MKILSLYFKNINSLEGESRIHFDRAPISDGGVFAITGPNGSGKSSILDAITLGLYGETFRFDRPAEHVMTKSTKESFVEVDFALGEDKYRSSWHVSRQDDGANSFQVPEMKLLQLNGSEQLLEQSAQKVREKMAELTGMDFHKFGKSMVLAQGEFSAFLNALDSERMDILEKISGTDIYQEYKQQAEQQFSQANTRLQQLEQDLSATPLMDEATREASEADFEDFKQQKIELTQEQQKIEQQLAEVNQVAVLEKQIEKLQKQTEQAESKQAENQQLLQQIEQVQDVSSLENELTAIDQQVVTVAESKKTLDAFRSELQDLKNQLKAGGIDPAAIQSANSSLQKSVAEQKASLDELSLKLSDLNFVLPKETALLETLKQQCDEKKSNMSVSETWLQDHAGDEVLQENFPQITELQTLRKTISEKAEQQAVFEKLNKKTTVQLTKKQKNIESLTQKNEVLAKLIDEETKALQTIADGMDLHELQDLESEQKERLQNLQEMHDLATVNAKLSKKGLFNQIISFTQGDKEEQHLKNQHEKLQLELGREQNVINTLEAAVANEALLQKMQQDRQHLVDGKPCPLCGALDHPYAHNAPAVSNSKQVLAEQRKKVKTLAADLEAMAKQVKGLQKKAEKDEQKDNKLQFLCMQWNSLANKLNVASEEMDIGNISLMKTLLKQEKKETANISNLVKKYTKQQAKIDLTKNNIEKNLVVLSRLTTEMDALNQEKESQPQQDSAEQKAYQEAEAQEKVMVAQLKQQLTELGENLPDKGKEAALLKKLQSRKQEYQTHVLRKETLVEEIQQLQQKIADSHSKLGQLNEQIEEVAVEQKKEEMAGMHLALIEKQKLIAEKEAVFAQQESALNETKKQLAEKAQSVSGGDLEKLRENIAFVKRKPQLEQAHLQASQNIEANKSQIDKLQSELDTANISDTIEFSEQELKIKQKDIKQKLDIAKQEISSLQNKLDRQDDLKEKHQALSSKITEQKAITETYAAELNVAKDDNGTHFRKKVKQELADKLMAKSNQILEKISGRYYVRTAESEHGLALEIEDTKQNNARRLPKTLSGGESFIVSLALALGLAEMTHDGHALDSLFLDEGFGNLDAESLYQAMTTLESLKTHGKTVGVISHVEGVKKRIKTQIEMIKKPNGFSALKMVS